MAVGAEVAPEAGVVILAIAGDRLPARRGPDAQAARAMAGGQVTTVPGKAQVVDHVGQTHQVMAQLAAGPVEEIDEITALPLAPGLGRPAGGHPLTIRGQGGGVEAALVPGADGGPQGPQQTAVGRIPQAQGLVIGGGDQQAAGLVDADALDRAGMHARFEAEQGIGGQLPGLGPQGRGQQEQEQDEGRGGT